MLWGLDLTISFSGYLDLSFSSRHFFFIKALLGTQALQCRYFMWEKISHVQSFVFHTVRSVYAYIVNMIHWTRSELTVRRLRRSEKAAPGETLQKARLPDERLPNDVHLERDVTLVARTTRSIHAEVLSGTNTTRCRNEVYCWLESELFVTHRIFSLGCDVTCFA